MNGISDDTSKINTYVGDDGLIHFTNKDGADTVLNFNSGNGKYIIDMISASWSRSATYSSRTSKSYYPCFSLPKELEINLTVTVSYPANGAGSNYKIYGYNNTTSTETSIISKNYSRNNTTSYIISGYDSIRFYTEVKHSGNSSHSGTATHKFTVTGIINS